MQLDRRALAASLALALLAAACGSSATSAPTASTAAGPTQAPAESQAAGATDQPSATDNGPAVSLTPGSAPELEAMLPSSVNGVTFTKTSFSGATFPVGIPVNSGDLGTFLQANGKTLADVNIAMATPTDTSKAGTFLMAFQVKGVDGTKLAEAIAGTSSSDLKPATVGGKQVLQAGAAGMGLVLYIKGDVVFYILAFGDAALTEGILTALP